MTADIDEDAMEPEEGEMGGEEAEEVEEEKPKKKVNKKKLAAMAGLGVLALIIVGGGAAFMLGFLDSMLGIEREKTSAEIQLGAPVRVELPQIKADLKTGRCRAPFLRAIVVVQLDSKDQDKLEDKKTEVIDPIITHLRDQERQDLTGKAGSDQLRFDLVNILNNVLAPTHVHGILFKEFLLQ